MQAQIIYKYAIVLCATHDDCMSDVGVANLATRAALPLAGGFEPPLPGAVETEGWPKPNPTKYSPRHNTNPGQHIADPGEFSFYRREEA